MLFSLKDRPHPFDRLRAGSSPLTPWRIYDPSRERGQDAPRSYFESLSTSGPTHRGMD